MTKIGKLAIEAFRPSGLAWRFKANRIGLIKHKALKQLAYPYNFGR